MSSRVRFRCALVVMMAALAGARCGTPSAEGTATRAASASAAPAAGAPSASGSAAAAPHGDHSPHHGGSVLMYRDLHYEVVLRPAGGAELYLSDAVRKELPASIVSDVAIEVDRPKRKTEQIDMTIDASGERWEGPSQPVKEDDATVRVAFTFQGEPVTVDLPFRSYFKPATPAAPTDAAAPAPSGGAHGGH